MDTRELTAAATADVPACTGSVGVVDEPIPAAVTALAELAPGPGLAAALASIDRSMLDGYGRVLVMQATARQAAHWQAQLFADLVAVAACPPGPVVPGVPVPVTGETGEVAEFAAEEIAAALTWTRRMAEGQLELGWSLIHRLPAVHAALSEGRIDVPKARVFERETHPLPDPAARAVCDQLLPDAPRLTSGQLRARLQRLVLTIDPEAARLREEKAVAERRVISGLEFDGTTSITVLGLPTERATAAMERVDAIAQAARRAGDARTTDQLRADTVLDLLDGTLSGPMPGPRKGVIELTVPLTTLMGLSEEPGELAGWGPITAEIARRTAAQQRCATWRFRVTDDTAGVGDSGGGTGSGANSAAESSPSGDTDSVSSADRAGGGHVDGGGRGSGAGRGNGGCTCGAGAGDDSDSRGATRTDADSDGVGAADGGMVAYGTTRRRPNAWLDGYIRTRDRTCRFPGCRIPSSHTDLDHTIPYQHNGRTHPNNLGAICRTHHRAKHQGGWKLTQNPPGVFHWTSPHGHHYTVPPDSRHGTRGTEHRKRPEQADPRPPPPAAN